MIFLDTEYSTLLQLLVFFVHVSNRLFVAYDVLVVATSGAVLGIKPEVVLSVHLKGS